MSWDAATEIFAETLPGYEERTEQTGLAHTIEAALAEGTHLLAQAGCGTGKSLANLVPGIEHARRVGEPVVVATATKALQAQYFAKDLPFLARALSPLLGDFRYALLKGRSNYVCKAKLVEEDAEKVTNIAALREELENDDHHGDVEDLVTEITGADRALITVSADECPGKRDCPFGPVCFAEAAKERAQQSDVVVVNHALLVRDLLVREATEGVSGILPEYSRLLVDEAHDLEEYTTSALGQELSEKGLRDFADQADKLLDSGATDSLRGDAVKLFAALGNTLAKNTTLALDDDLLVEVYEPLSAVRHDAVVLFDSLRDYRPVSDNEGMAKKRVGKRAENLISRLDAVLGLETVADGNEEDPAPATEIVRWIEREDRTFRGNRTSTIKLQFAPLHVGPFLAKRIWSVTPSVLTSATLAIDNNFGYIAERLGLDLVGYESFDAGSPFDFAKQAALYIPEGGYPEPTGRTAQEWSARSIAEIGELVRASGGRALLLFTSRKEMTEAHRVLAPGIQRQGYTVLLQDGSTSTGKLTEAKIADPTSVLFALKSFMTGADFQGDVVRLVVLNKLPFPVPSDIMNAARMAAIDAVATDKWVNGSFPKFMIPAMSLTLLQAYGRAIRTKNDEAVIAILDPRINTKGYGKKLRRALPEARRVGTLADAQAHLNELAGRRDS